MKTLTKIIAGATLLASAACNKPEEPIQVTNPLPLEQKVESTLEQKVESLRQIPNFKDYSADIYHQHDQTILDYVTELNGHFSELSGCKGLDPVVAKAWLIQESGSKNHTNSFLRDPAQISNKGDYGLNDLQNPKFFWKLGLEDMSEDFKKFEHTQWKNKKLDYSGSNSMTAEESIHGGLMFLFGKHFEDYHTEIVPDGEPFTYVVKSGDTLGAIAQDNGSYLAFIERINPGVSPNTLSIGDKIKVQSAHKNSQPHNCRSWAETFDAYNGNGTEGYSKDIMDRANLQDEKN